LANKREEIAEIVRQVPNPGMAVELVFDILAAHHEQKEAKMGSLVEALKEGGY
jgi:hypothetical protein